MAMHCSPYFGSHGFPHFGPLGARGPHGLGFGSWGHHGHGHHGPLDHGPLGLHGPHSRHGPHGHHGPHGRFWPYGHHGHGHGHHGAFGARWGMWHRGPFDLHSPWLGEESSCGPWGGRCRGGSDDRDGGHGHGHGHDAGSRGRHGDGGRASCGAGGGGGCRSNAVPAARRERSLSPERGDCQQCARGCRVTWADDEGGCCCCGEQGRGAAGENSRRTRRLSCPPDLAPRGRDACQR